MSVTLSYSDNRFGNVYWNNLFQNERAANNENYKAG